MTEQELKVSVQLQALTYMCTHLQGMIWTLINAKADDIKNAIADGDVMLANHSFPDIPPEYSDMYASEFQASVKNIMLDAFESWKKRDEKITSLIRED